MAAPTSLPTWDSGNVNTTVTTGGQASSGYATDEVPNSGELNYWMLLVYLWLAYLRGQLTISPSVSSARLVADTGSDWSRVGGVSGSGRTTLNSSGTTGSVAVIDLDIPDGYTLASITYNALGTASSVSSDVRTRGSVWGSSTR